MALESVRHSSDFDKVYALTITYNLTRPRGAWMKEFWGTKNMI